MTKPNRLVLRESLWVCGDTMPRSTRWAGNDVVGLRERGMEMFVYKHGDEACLTELRRLLLKTDKHVIFSWLMPFELSTIYPLLRDRKNFSVVVDDWWIQPFEFMRDADYIIFRKYHGIAVRLGKIPFIHDGSKPPFFLNPFPQISKYSLFCMAMRPLAHAVAPLLEIRNARRRREEGVNPGKYLYFPFAINGATQVPVQELQPEYDFANTSGTFGTWIMRDPHVPANLSYANLYHDRKKLTDGIARFENNPYKFYDCRREKSYLIPYNEYLQKSQQSRFVIATGGLHAAALVKNLEFGRVAAPMIGSRAPFEHPWLDDCMFPVDIMRLPSGGLKPLLTEAMDRYPTFKENCLKWREKLVKLYDFQTLLDMLQEQADGKPIRPGYLRPDPIGGTKVQS